MKITTNIKLEVTDHEFTNRTLKKAMDRPREMSANERDSLAYQMTLAVDTVAEKAFLMGLKKGMESK